MKNKIYILTLVFTVLVTTGCKDFLTRDPLDQVTDETYWANENNVKAYFFAFYSSRFAGFGQTDAGGLYFTRQELNDDFSRSNMPAFPTGATPSSGTWNDYFGYIRADNIAIDRLTRVTFRDQATTNHWMGVARFFRALDYSRFATFFGDVPYYDFELTSEKDPRLYNSRNPYIDVMDNCLEDFEFASANVKVSDGVIGAMQQVVFKDVVDGFFSRQMLIAGTTLKYKPNTSAAELAKAEIYLKASKDAAYRVINSGRYSLANNYQHICSTVDMNAGTSANVKSEMLLFRVYDTGMITHAIMGYNSIQANQLVVAPKDMIDSYLCTNGLPLRTVSGGDNSEYLGDDNADNQFANRDGRLAATFQKDYSVEFVHTPFSSSGYFVYKFRDEETKGTNQALGSNNVTDAPIIRLGEVMLNYIEACVELADMGKYTLVQNDMDITINRLRNRSAYATKLPALQVVGGQPAIGGVVYDDADRDSTVPSMIWEIRRERRLELLYEGFRLVDLKRWRKLDYLKTDLYPKKNIGAWVTKTAASANLVLADINGTVTSAQSVTTGSGYIVISVNGRSAATGNISDRNYLDAIPTEQIDLYKRNGSTLTQNPGWE